MVISPRYQRVAGRALLRRRMAQCRVETAGLDDRRILVPGVLVIVRLSVLRIEQWNAVQKHANRSQRRGSVRSRGRLRIAVDPKQPVLIRRVGRIAGEWTNIVRGYPG